MGERTDSLSTEVIKVSKKLPLNCIVKEFAESISSNKKEISSLSLSIDVIKILEDISMILDKK